MKYPQWSGTSANSPLSRRPPHFSFASKPFIYEFVFRLFFSSPSVPLGTDLSGMEVHPGMTLPSLEETGSWSRLLLCPCGPDVTTASPPISYSHSGTKTSWAASRCRVHRNTLRRLKSFLPPERSDLAEERWENVLGKGQARFRRRLDELPVGFRQTSCFGDRSVTPLTADNSRNVWVKWTFISRLRDRKTSGKMVNRYTAAASAPRLLQRLFKKNPKLSIYLCFWVHD